MSEIKTLLHDKELAYSGLFKLRELYKLIDQWFMEHGYDKNELKNYEDVTEDEKEYMLELLPYKNYTDYVRGEIRIFMIIKNCKETIVEKENLKIHMQKGNIKFSFDAYLITDYEDSWQTTPFYYFLRTLFDKFVYKIYITKYENQVIKDCNEIQNQIKSYLNMQRF
ncbi:MAG: hypothetical protein QXG00_02340 [Candidatus Woesearchaeota archaeon]